MRKKILFTKNYISGSHINKRVNKKFSNISKKIIEEAVTDISNFNKTLSVLNKNYNFNFKLNDLKKFKKFKTICLIGMGGSILGTEAIYNFLEKKLKKKFIFLTI